MNNNVLINKTDLQLFYHDKCDKYDYLLAVACGAIAGLIDIFLVGIPENSVLGKWTDKQTDMAVVKFAKKLGWKPKNQDNEPSNEVANAIQFLEGLSKKQRTINYEQTSGGDVDHLFRMSTKNHHLKSLAHSPDIIGLFFSILNQFTSTASFADNGRLITIKSNEAALQGNNLIAKLYCGLGNWFIHLMSDVAGSNDTRRKGGRGSGLSIPFYELLQFCDFGKLQVDKYRNTVATVATKVFEQGYDARFGMAQKIPVLFCNLSIKLIWALKHHFYHHKPIVECIPTSQHDDLRIMLLIGNGTMCAMDAIDAGARSGGNAVTFMLRINFVGWCKFVALVFNEIMIRTGVALPLEIQLEYYRKINEALATYYDELSKIDVRQYKIIVSDFSMFVDELWRIKDESQINGYLHNIHEKFGIPLPYQGDFDVVMQDNKPIVFK